MNRRDFGISAIAAAVTLASESKGQLDVKSADYLVGMVHDDELPPGWPRKLDAKRMDPKHHCYVYCDGKRIPKCVYYDIDMGFAVGFMVDQEGEIFVADIVRTRSSEVIDRGIPLEIHRGKITVVPAK